MMPSASMIAKMILLIAGLRVIGYNEGMGAYYAPGVMEAVCERRVENGWTVGLDCCWPCLVSGIEHASLGEYWLVDIPGHSMELCLVVDVGRSEHLEALRQRGEVVELSWEMAQDAGWDGYQGGVRVWRLTD